MATRTEEPCKEKTYGTGGPELFPIVDLDAALVCFFFGFFLVLLSF